MKSVSNPRLPQPPDIKNLRETTLYLTDLKREVERHLVFLNQDLIIGQSRLQVLQSTATSTMLKSTLSNTDIGVLTVAHSAGGSKLLVTVSTVTLSVALT